MGGRQNSTLATADGQKNFRRYIKPDLATVDGQKKIIGVYNKPDLATVDGQKNYRGRQKRAGGAKKSGEQKKKRSPRKIGVYWSSVGGAKWSRGGAKFPPAGGRP